MSPRLFPVFRARLHPPSRVRQSAGEQQPQGLPQPLSLLHFRQPQSAGGPSLVSTYQTKDSFSNPFQPLDAIVSCSSLVSVDLVTK